MFGLKIGIGGLEATERWIFGGVLPSIDFQLPFSLFPSLRAQVPDDADSFMHCRIM